MRNYSEYELIHLHQTYTTLVILILYLETLSDGENLLICSPSSNPTHSAICTSPLVV